MKTATLKRNQTSDQGTFGKMFVDGVLCCFTGELPWRDNQESVSCIPPGQHVCKWVMSPKRGHNIYMLLGTEPRTAVEIHSGNYCGDVSKGFKSHVEGCILLGNLLGKLGDQDAILDSKAALAHFESLMGGEDFLLTIEEHMGSNV